MNQSSLHERQPISKLWGWEEVVVNNDRYCGKLLHINSGYQCSLHYHPRKHETFMALEGVVCVELGTETLFLSGVHRDSVEVPPNTPHRFWAVSDSATLVEFSSPHSDNDVVRIEPSKELPYYTSLKPWMLESGEIGLIDGVRFVEP